MLSPAEKAYHLRQYAKPYQSTTTLAAFITGRYGSLSGNVMDVGCGAGATLYWLREWGVLGSARVLGIDADRDLLSIAGERIADAGFLRADFTDPLPVAEFVLSIQVLSFIEDWRPALMRLLDSTKRALFVSSLFWDGVSTHTHATDSGHKDAHYNVIEAREFADACAPRHVDWLPFATANLNADRTKLGTYTAMGRDFSGPLHLPWRLAVVAS